MKKERLDTLLRFFFTMRKCVNCPVFSNCDAWIGLGLLKVPGTEAGCMSNINDWLNGVTKEID